MRVNQDAWAASSPRTMEKKDFCRPVVIGPGFPVPIRRLSISRTGVSSAAVPVTNTSSAIYISSRVNRSSITTMPCSRASSMTEFRVIPSRMEVNGVVLIRPLRTMKIFSPVPSET